MHPAGGGARGGDRGAGAPGAGREPRPGSSAPSGGGMKRSWPALGALAALGLALAGTLEAQELLTLCGSLASALQSNPQLAVARHVRGSALADAERFKPAFRPDVEASLGQIVRAPRTKFPKKDEQVTVL